MEKFFSGERFGGNGRCHGGAREDNGSKQAAGHGEWKPMLLWQITTIRDHKRATSRD
jgi:hypothetical protein